MDECPNILIKISFWNYKNSIFGEINHFTIEKYTLRVTGKCCVVPASAKWRLSQFCGGFYLASYRAHPVFPVSTVLRPARHHNWQRRHPSSSDISEISAWNTCSQRSRLWSRMTCRHRSWSRALAWPEQLELFSSDSFLFSPSSSGFSAR